MLAQLVPQDPSCQAAGSAASCRLCTPSRPPTCPPHLPLSHRHLGQDSEMRGLETRLAQGQSLGRWRKVARKLPGLQGEQGWGHRMGVEVRKSRDLLVMNKVSRPESPE